MKALFLFFIATNAFALSNPGPDGIRFNKLEIYRVEKTLRDQRSEKNLEKELEAELAGLQTILATGKRTLAWLDKINSMRTDGNKLDMTAKGVSKGVPMNDPMKTNSQILIDKYNQYLKELSPLVINVVTGTGDLPSQAPLSDEEFIKTIRQIDVLYQHTVRWSGSKDSLDWYKTRSLWDIRGYIALKAIPDLETKLSNWNGLSETDKKQYSTWLLSLCHNGNIEDVDCQSELTKDLAANRALDYYTDFNKYGEKQYNSFFAIPKTRPEIYWNDEKTKFFTPFLAPARTDVKAWLADNVQDEWKGPGFNLLLDFKDSSKDPIPHIQFQSGVTAHVNDIAGDTITMDGDYAINSYDQRWTIRHEYGHVLGFVDCYLEFYDTNEKAMIYYEIDTDNLMCSRHGNLQPGHITSLRAAYK